MGFSPSESYWTVLTIPILSDIRQDPNIDVVTTCFKMKLRVSNEIAKKN